MNIPVRSSVLFINSIAPEQPQALERLQDMLGRPLRPILLRNTHADDPSGADELHNLVRLEIDFEDQSALAQAIQPFANDILVVTCKDDASAAYLKHLAQHLPHLTLPLPETLEWATEKTKMRAHFDAYDPQVSPKFTTAKDARPATLRRIERAIGYPLIVKPSGLTSSLLISVCENREEFEAALEHTMQNLTPRYGAGKGRRPEVLVEQFMDGGIYFSMDVYVGTAGQTWFLPPVYGKTGRDIGFEDVFGYMRALPTQLTPEQTTAAEHTADTAVKALNLRSCTCHVELMLTTDGWKIIELGPRIGGFRHEMYSKAFGINHALNDLLVRMGEEPVIPTTPLGYSAFLQFYPQHEGVLKHIDGLSAVRKLPSVERLSVFKHPGDACLFAKHGGSHVLEVVLFNEDRTQLRHDIRAIERAIEISTEPLTAGQELYQARLTV
jgi:biotin carboxylase